MLWLTFSGIQTDLLFTIRNYTVNKPEQNSKENEQKNTQFTFQPMTLQES